MAKRRMTVQIIPSVILRLPSTISVGTHSERTQQTFRLIAWSQRHALTDQRQHGLSRVGIRKSGLTFGTDTSQSNALGRDEVERLLHVVYFVHTHAASLGLGQFVSRDHLQEGDEVFSIPEVLVDFFDLNANLAQMRVAPSSERLRRKASIERLATLSPRANHCSPERNAPTFFCWRSHAKSMMPALGSMPWSVSSMMATVQPSQWRTKKETTEKPNATLLQRGKQNAPTNRLQTRVRSVGQPSKKSVVVSQRSPSIRYFCVGVSANYAYFIT